MNLKWMAMLVVLFAGQVTAMSAPINERGVKPAWVQQEKIRGYWSAPSDIIKPLHEAGFNTLFQRLEIAVDEEQRSNEQLYPGRSFKEEEAEVLKASRLAKELGMRYFHVLDPGPVESIPFAGFKNNPRRYHDGKMPCPLDKVFWDRVITNRFMYVIKLLSQDTYQLDGLLIDPEMYYFNGGFMTIPCYCEDCIKEFSKQKSKGKELCELDLEKRIAWLSEKNLLLDYEKWQSDVVAERIAEMRGKIRSERPGLILGFFIFQPLPWFKALAKGLSTEDMPVWICTEGTYSGAFNDDYLKYQKKLEEQVGAPYAFLPGIWVGYDEKGNLPEAFMKVVPSNVYHRAILSAGYWVYASCRWGHTPQKAEPFVKLFAEINSELDKFQTSKGTYKSSLIPQALPVERPGDLHEVLLAARHWQRVSDVPNSVPRTVSNTSIFRGPHMAVINATQGDEITIRMQTIQLGEYTSEGKMVLYNPGMSIIADKTCSVNQSIEHKFKVDWTGPYALIVSAGTGLSNAYTLEVNGATWIFHGDKIAINKTGGLIYFWMSEEKDSFEIKLAGEGGETVTYCLYNPKGQKVFNLENIGDISVKKINCKGMSGIWTLQASDVVDDCSFEVTGVNLYAVNPLFVVKNEIN